MKNNFLVIFQMLSRRFFWFLYRRRNKFLTLIFIIFTIIFFSYESKNDSSSAYTTLIDKPKRILDLKKIRINRETYQIPEPCHGCPGENGAGVSLTEEERKDLDVIMKREFFNL